MTDEEKVRADYPSARSVSRGLSFFAIQAIRRDPETRRVVGDRFLGSGRSEAIAWADAVANLHEKDVP